MRPEAQSTESNQEQMPIRQEHDVEKPNGIKTPEVGIDANAESFELKSELSAAAADAGKNITTVIPTPVSSDAVKTDDNSAIADNNPLIANDDDLIEKEWVDRAKKIVAETQDNPYKRDEEVSKLQIDYLKKRFGRELGGTE